MGWVAIDEVFESIERRLERDLEGRAVSHVCAEDGCGRGFESPQGLGAHRRFVHRAGATKAEAKASEGSANGKVQLAEVPRAVPSIVEVGPDEPKVRIVLSVSLREV